MGTGLLEGAQRCSRAASCVHGAAKAAAEVGIGHMPTHTLPRLRTWPCELQIHRHNDEEIRHLTRGVIPRSQYPQKNPLSINLYEFIKNEEGLILTRVEYERSNLIQEWRVAPPGGSPTIAFTDAYQCLRN